MDHVQTFDTLSEALSHPARFLVWGAQQRHLLPQFSLEHFAARTFRYLIDEDDPVLQTANLGQRQVVVIPDCPSKIILARVGCIRRLPNHEGQSSLAGYFVRDADDGGLGDGGVLDQVRLDLAGGDLNALHGKRLAWVHGFTPRLGTLTYFDLDHVADAVYDKQMLLAARGRAEETDVSCWPPELRVVCGREKRIAGTVNVPAYDAGRGNFDLTHLLESLNLTAAIVS